MIQIVMLRSISTALFAVFFSAQVFRIFIGPLMQATPVLYDLNDFLSFGIGGVLAGILLYWKRLDDQRHAEELKTLAERSLEAIDKVTDALNAQRDALTGMTALNDIEERIKSIYEEVRK